MYRDIEYDNQWWRIIFEPGEQPRIEKIESPRQRTPRPRNGDAKSEKPEWPQAISDPENAKIAAICERCEHFRARGCGGQPCCTEHKAKGPKLFQIIADRSCCRFGEHHQP